MIIAIFGSPRKEGNTEILMNEFLKSYEEKKEIKRFYLNDIDLKPCISCGGCNNTGVCVFKDDIWDIYENIENADAIVMSSPIYFGSMSAQLKTFIDRAQPFWARKYLLGKKEYKSKKGFIISVGAINTVKYFNNLDLIIRTHLNTLNINYTGSLFYKGIDEKGEIKKIPDALEKAYQEGKKFYTSLNK